MPSPFPLGGGKTQQPQNERGQVGDDSGQTQFIPPQVVEDVESTRQVSIEFEFQFSRHIQPGGQPVEEPLVLPAVGLPCVGQPAGQIGEETLRFHSMKISAVSTEIVNLRVLGELVGGELGLEPLPVERGASALAVGTMIGDLHAQVAAGWSGSGELGRLAAELGLDSLRAYADEIMHRTEAGMRAGIAAPPDGEYHEEMEMEIEGIAEPQTLAVTVRIEGSDVYADFTDTSAQVRRTVNCPTDYTRAYVALPLKRVCDSILPNNQGTYELLHVSVPEGTLLNPTSPAACFWRLSAGNLVSELMFRVLSRIAPDRVPADSGSMPTWQFYVNGVRPNGEAFALHQHAFGGMGGWPGRRRTRLGELSLQRARCLHRVVGDGDAGAVRGARAHPGLGRGARRDYGYG